MPIAPTVEDYLTRHGAKYDLVSHPRSGSSIETADAADVPGDRLVKSVLLQDDDGMLLAVLPSTASIHLGQLEEETHRHHLRLADEDDLQSAFPDCRNGAIPPLGPAYGIRTILDDTVEAQEDVYFEAGDREHLVHMTVAQFMAVVGPAQRVHFSKAERHHHHR